MKSKGAKIKPATKTGFPRLVTLTAEEFFHVVAVLHPTRSKDLLFRIDQEGYMRKCGRKGLVLGKADEIRQAALATINAGLVVMKPREALFTGISSAGASINLKTTSPLETKPVETGAVAVSLLEMGTTKSGVGESGPGQGTMNHSETASQEPVQADLAMCIPEGAGQGVFSASGQVTRSVDAVPAVTGLESPKSKIGNVAVPAPGRPKPTGRAVLVPKTRPVATIASAAIRSELQIVRPVRGGGGRQTPANVVGNEAVPVCPQTAPLAPALVPAKKSSESNGQSGNETVPTKADGRTPRISVPPGATETDGRQQLPQPHVRIRAWYMLRAWGNAMATKSFTGGHALAFLTLVTICALLIFGARSGWLFL